MPMILPHFIPSSYKNHKQFNKKHNLLLNPPQNSNLSTSSTKSHNLNDALSLINQQLATNNSVKVYENVTLLIHLCGQQRNIEIGRKVDEFVTTHFSNDLHLHTHLITMYSLCGYPVDCRIVFDRLQTENNLFLWNAMISVYTKNELYCDAMLLFCKLVNETELNPDNYTLPCVIKSCALLSDVGFGETVHGLAVKLGLVLDLFVCNALVMMYGKFELVSDALKLFKNLPSRNLVSWNSMIRVFAENGFQDESCYFFLQMLEDGDCLIPDVTTVVTLLPICAVKRDIEMGMIIHGFAVKLGLSNEVTVNNALIDMYSKCECSSAARTLFEKNKIRNTVSWNSIIWNCSRDGDELTTFDLLKRMQIEGDDIKLNDITILNVLPAFRKNSQLTSLKELHGYSIRHGFFRGEYVANAFIVAYAKCRSVASAYSIFRGITTKTINSWNAIIDGYAQYGDPGKAIIIYLEMKFLGLNPDLFSLNSLILACSELRLLSSGKEIHGFALRNGLDKDSFISVSLLSFYFRCDKLNYCRSVFDQIENKNLVSWNAMISGYSQQGSPVEAFDIFRHMVEKGIQPNAITITSLLAACSQLSCLRLGKEIHGFILRAHLTKQMFISSSLIDMYAKCGCLGLSHRFFDCLTLPEKDLASWNVLISGYGYHGHGNEALLLFEQLQTRSGLNPDHLTFVGLLVACNHAGRVEKGLEYLNNMDSLYGLEPKLEHYTCVVDMLARAGRLHDALNLIESMPMKADSKIWSCLLSSCRIHGDIVLGRLAAKKLLQLDPSRAENYVLASNLLAQAGKWDDVRNLRAKMREKGLQKDAGCSWLEYKGKIHNFVVGDYTLPKSEKLREMWLDIEKKIRCIGYIPDTSSVLHDLGEDEKLEVLRGHSEKLAVCFGLLNTSKGVTLRICKNLRICSDCHNAIKLVSRVCEREIVVRDNKRFHHFKNGSCSCRDYW
ncbi:pentatricopeptide repeat-containing protein At1g18485 [Silene latifolia]|uniref:pentatricopeptide repeat-containing protein At1g18485 n=1 Tax=Silene latifolia TaxID=37657 RepID=UPI003D76EC6C